MSERGKLIEILQSAESAFYWDSNDKGFIEKIADHLISNGVTVQIRAYSYANGSGRSFHGG